MKLALALAAIALGGCWVDRKTNDFACTTNDDCLTFSPQRRCDTDIGYCVPGDNPNACPSICNGACDMVAKTCTIECQNPAACSGNQTCPDGFDCTINCGMNGCGNIECKGDSNCTITCNGNNACGNVECSDSGTCNVNCTGGNACDSIDCNGSHCNVMCVGGGACDDVDCDTACRCDVACMAGQSCASRTCSDATCNSPLGCVSTQTGCPATCN